MMGVKPQNPLTDTPSPKKGGQPVCKHAPKMVTEVQISFW